MDATDFYANPGVHCITISLRINIMLFKKISWIYFLYIIGFDGNLRLKFFDIFPPPNFKVTGECGHQPHVRVWDVHDRSLLVEFPGHKYGINCVVSVITSL